MDYILCYIHIIGDQENTLRCSRVHVRPLRWCDQTEAAVKVAFFFYLKDWFERLTSKI